MAGSRLSQIDARNEQLARMLTSASPATLVRYDTLLSLSWIHHENALEGVVLSFPELRAALEEGIVSDVSLIPSYRDIQAQHGAIQAIRELAAKKRLPFTVDIVKRLYCSLAPDEQDPKAVRFRPDMPLHRLYFHDIAQASRIESRVGKLVEWLNDRGAQTGLHPVKHAAKAHLKLLQIYPFTRNSGKVARLLMNLLLMRTGYHPAIIHSTERQGYYESLRSGGNALTNIVIDSLDNTIASGLRFFADRQGVARSA